MTLKYSHVYNRYPVKKSKESSLTKLDLTLASEDFGLEDREHSSTWGYLIQMLNVTKAKPCEKCCEINVQEKKREHISRILNVEQGTFTPLSATGGMGRECSMFVKKLDQLISTKRKEELSVVTCGIRCKGNFVLLRSCQLFIRGSRKSNNEYEKLNEISFNAITIVKRNDS